MHPTKCSVYVHIIVCCATQEALEEPGFVINTAKANLDFPGNWEEIQGKDRCPEIKDDERKDHLIL